MSGPVDVLAEIKEAAAGRVSTRMLMAAHDAVAVLIEADREYDSALTELSDLNRRIAEHGWIEVEHDALRKAGARVVRARSRRHDALANVGSAS